MADETRRIHVPVVLAGAAAWSWRILVIVAAAAVVVLVLIELYVVVVPVVLAVFLAAALEPLVCRLAAHRVPRTLAAAVVFLGTLAVIVGAFTWIGQNVADEFEDVGRQLDQAVADTKEWLQGPPFNLTPERVEQLEADLREAVRGIGTGAQATAARGARTATEVLSGIILLLFTLFFLLKDGRRMGEWFRARLPPNQREDAVALTRRSREIMKSYLVATALTGLVDGVLIAIALVILGVPLVLPLAVLTFLGGFIPIVGATVAGLVAALVALVSGGLVTALLVVAATIVVQQVEGNLLQPLILERAVRLHPLVTVWAVGAGLIIGGLLGAFLSVPVVAVAAAVGSHYRRRAGFGDGDPDWKGTRKRGRPAPEPEPAADEPAATRDAE